ncbi:MAG: glycosyltransferase, partial [Gemmataceae bacterium]
KNVDVMPNGVDANYFTPGHERRQPNSCVFWGRLDFEPNIQAIEWFVERVWPRLRRAVPDAEFRIYGFQPTNAVLKYTGVPGVSITSDLPDLRPEVRGNALVVLPFVSGGGIKNKLLEAAAMGMPIVASARVRPDTTESDAVPWRTAHSAADWERIVQDVWRNPEGAETRGQAARNWVVENHTWAAAARIALAGLPESRMISSQPMAVVS